MQWQMFRAVATIPFGGYSLPLPFLSLLSPLLPCPPLRSRTPNPAKGLGNAVSSLSGVWGGS